MLRDIAPLCPYENLSLHRSIFHLMLGEIFAKHFSHHRFVIGPVAKVHLGNGISFRGNEVGADVVDELVVVEDDVVLISSLGNGIQRLP